MVSVWSYGERRPDGELYCRRRNVNDRSATVGDSSIRGMNSTFSAYLPHSARHIAFHCSDLPPGPHTQSDRLQYKTYQWPTAPGSRIQRIPLAAYITAVSCRWTETAMVGIVNRVNAGRRTSSFATPVVMYLAHYDSTRRPIMDFGGSRKSAFVLYDFLSRSKAAKWHWNLIACRDIATHIPTKSAK